LYIAITRYCNILEYNLRIDIIGEKFQEIVITLYCNILEYNLIVLGREEKFHSIFGKYLNNSKAQNLLYSLEGGRNKE